jgi:hypothetical protein
MGETGDILQEFKNAKPPEKAVIVLGGLAVVGIGIYLYTKGNAAASAANAATGSTSATGQAAGYPTANGVPVLPGGTNPLYDPNGNLVGYQNQPTTGNQGPTGPQGPAGPGGSPGHPQNWFTNVLGKIGYNATIRPGGLDNNGQRFWIGKTGNSSLFYAPWGSTIQQGAQGRVWITVPGQKQQLLTGPGMTPSKTSVATTAKK